MGQSYRDLVAWQKGMQLVTAIYKLTHTFPADERYGLTNQLRRAAVSIPSNIAEGQARFSRREFHRFLLTAKGSLAELETQIDIARNLGYARPFETSTLLKTTSELGRILNGLLASTKASLADF
jgi:four helix bundle protein